MSVFSIITLVLILCVIRLTISKDSQIEKEPEFKCNPGEVFMDGCNTCTCSETGRLEFCTYKLCPSEIGSIDPGHPEFKCIPGQLFRHDCHDCRCYDGKNAFCDSVFCNTKNNDQNCEDGDAKKNDCNLCKCIGGEWACTKKFCVPQVDIFEYKACESGNSIFRGCNVCYCIPDVGYACEKKECIPDEPTYIFDDKNCKENEEHNLGCTICRCIPGQGFLCDDKKNCAEAVFVN